MKDKVIRIIVNPVSQINYSSFYLEGLKKVFEGRISYSFRPFRQISNSFKQCLVFIIVTKDRNFNIAIDFHDSSEIQDVETLAWCDVYCKINFNKIETLNKLMTKIKDENKLMQEMSKIKSIPPSFGIRSFGVFGSISMICKLIFSKGIAQSIRKKAVLSVLRAYIKRLPYSSYLDIKSDKAYVFHVSSIWNIDTKGINISRANFIKSCKRNGAFDFEGGLVDIGYPYDYIEDIDEVFYRNRKISLEEYLKKTKESIFVFNGPSVMNCHGWKLGEYLAMGKAILSVPLSNELPGVFENKKEIHIVEDSFEGISEGITYIAEHPEYKKQLEKNALDYWDKYGKPDVVILNILDYLNLQK